MFMSYYIENLYMTHTDPLLTAVEDKDHADVTRLIDSGLDIHQVNEKGNGLLHIAVFNEDHAMIHLLLKRGIDVNYQGNGFTALEVACMFAWVAGAELLIQGGAKLDSIIPGGIISPLGVAITGPCAGNSEFRPHPIDQLNMVRLLISSGADVSVIQEDGETFLMDASYHGNADIVLDLIAAGLDPEARDENGDTAVQYALWGHHYHVEDIIIEEINYRYSCVVFAKGALPNTDNESPLQILPDDMVRQILDEYYRLRI